MKDFTFDFENKKISLSIRALISHDEEPAPVEEAQEEPQEEGCGIHGC